MIPFLWLKSVHVAAVLIFVGGLFAQTLAVAAGKRGEAATVALVSRWDGRITVPAILMIWLSGPLLATEGSWFSSRWLWAKLAIVIALTGLHGVQSGKLRRLGKSALPIETHALSPLGIVASAVALIALLVVAKPF